MLWWPFGAEWGPAVYTLAVVLSGAVWCGLWLVAHHRHETARLAAHLAAQYPPAVLWPSVLFEHRVVDLDDRAFTARFAAEVTA